MKTKVVGLTGGIGSGKSYIAKIFSKMNIAVYDSDKNAKVLMTDDKEVRKKIIALLGDNSYLSSGELDRNYIAEAIFKNEALLKKMNKIVHPAVRKDFKRFANSNIQSPYVVNEAALFVENGSYKDFDYLVTVVSPLEKRLERTMARDNSTRETVIARMKNQSTDEDKIKVSNFVIYNDQTENLFTQISTIHRFLVK